MTSIILVPLTFVFLFGNIELSEAASETPYWAGHKADLSSETEDGHWCELTIEYSKDGKQYSAFVEIPDSSNAGGGGSCKGLVDKVGKLERKDCTPGIWSQRDLVGTVSKPILDNVGGGSSGGCRWTDKTLQKKRHALMVEFASKKASEEKKRQALAKKAAEEKIRQELANTEIMIFSKKASKAIAKKLDKPFTLSAATKKAAEEKERRALAKKAAEDEKRQALARKAADEKKRKVNETSGLLSMLLLLTLIVSGVWIWSEFMSFLKRDTRQTSDFELNSEETRKLVDYQRKERVLERSWARAMNKVASLEQLGKGIRRTKTGQFDRRSKLGKKLSKELPLARASELRYQNELSNIQSETKNLTALPEKRASIWAETEARRIANRLILPALASVLIVAAVFDYPNNLMFLNDYWLGVGLSWFAILYILSKVQKKQLMGKLGY
jgi:hypothetical protein